MLADKIAALPRPPMKYDNRMIEKSKDPVEFLEQGPTLVSETSRNC